MQINRKWFAPATAQALGLAALTTTLGLQLMRLMISLALSVYRDRLGAGLSSLGLVAVGTFALAWLAPLVWRGLGARRALVLALGGLGAVRLAFQLIQDPLVQWPLACAGVVLFLWSLPLLLGYWRGTPAGLLWGPGILLGLQLDTTLHGLWGTYDYAWQGGVTSIVLALVLTGAQWALLALTVRATITFPAEQSEGAWASAWPLVGLGAGLFLELLVWQSVGWQTVAAGALDGTPTVIYLAAANVIALAAAVAWPRDSFYTIVVGILLALATVIIELPTAALAGAVATGVCIVLIGHAAAMPGTRGGIGRVGTAWGAGAVLLVLLVFGYYAGYDVRLPFDNGVLFIVAALVLGFAATAALRTLPEDAPRVTGDARRTVLVCGVALGAVALVGTLAVRASTPAPQVATGDGHTLRVMTYNLHFGYDVRGAQSLEAAAQAIEASGADVVGLEEVARGWYLNGSTDMLVWLAHRLRMPYAHFAPASDPRWGNAILSRYPLTEAGTFPLPRGAAAMNRSAAWVALDIGAGKPVYFSAIHLHHVEGDTEIRLAQISAFFNAWPAEGYPLILVGDFNSTPDSAEYARITSTGMRDAWALTGGAAGAGLTIPADGPLARIDYVWLSAGLNATRAQVWATDASDHRPVVVEVEVSKP